VPAEEDIKLLQDHTEVVKVDQEELLLEDLQLPLAQLLDQ
jgi:hypothetical protein